MTSERFGSPPITRKGGDLLEILAGPFFALIDATLDRSLMPVAALSMLGGVIATLLIAW